jgi:hypothetical protein
MPARNTGAHVDTVRSWWVRFADGGLQHDLSPQAVLVRVL